MHHPQLILSSAVEDNTILQIQGLFVRQGRQSLHDPAIKGVVFLLCLVNELQKRDLMGPQQEINDGDFSFHHQMKLQKHVCRVLRVLTGVLLPVL